MKKIAAKAAWVAAQGPLFACPVCGAALAVDATSLVCEHQHRFDLAKKGTVNFLNAPAPTEYGTEMLTARRRVLSAGLFAPFLEVIRAELTATDRFLDIGCGEGTPTAFLADSGAAGVGFDISAPAINLAGSLATSAFYCVADLAHLPFLDHSFSAVVDLFSPGAYQEFDRVLRPGGRVFKIIPNSDYLREIRQGLYANTAKGSYDNDRVLARFRAAYPAASAQTLTYDWPVTPDRFAAVVAMTPLSWQADPAKRAALLAHPPVTVRVAVTLLTATV